jgi:hypothetical protein
MAYCKGCGRYVGDYSTYSLSIPGKGRMVLCHRCKRWAERHPGGTSFPRPDENPQVEGKRVRAFAIMYLLSSLGLFALGAILILVNHRIATGVLLLIGAISLFFIGVGMRRFPNK